MCGEWDVSIRRACRVLEVDTSTYHYKSRRHDQAGIEARIKDICATRVRYGYRRVHVMLRREGWRVNAKKVYRIYNELGLQLRNKTPKRRVKAKLRDDRQPATQPNETWAMDFVHDQLATGRKIRVLTVIDTFSRFSPIVDPRFSYRAEHVVAALEQTCAAVGYPKTIRVDQGSEFISRDLDLWACQRRSKNGSPALPVLPHPHVAPRTRARSSSNPARPYIVRFSILMRLIWPSTGLVVHGKTRAALMASKSRRMLAANRANNVPLAAAST